MKQKRTLYGIYSIDAAQLSYVNPASIKTAIYTAIDAGLPWLQIRDKTFEKKLWPLWLDIAKAAQNAGTQLIVNDHIDLLSYLLEHLPSTSQFMPGLHLGQTDDTINVARHLFGQHILIGITCHNSLQLATLAATNGADYVAFGRFFPSQTKPDAPSATLNTLYEFRKQHNTCIAVIGGIHLKTIDHLYDSPANLYAVSNALWTTESVANTVKKFMKKLDSERATPDSYSVNCCSHTFT